MLHKLFKPKVDRSDEPNKSVETKKPGQPLEKQLQINSQNSIEVWEDSDLYSDIELDSLFAEIKQLSDKPDDLPESVNSISMQSISSQDLSKEEKSKEPII